MTVINQKTTHEFGMASYATSGLEIAPEAWTSIAPAARAVECSLGGTARSNPRQREAIVTGMVASWRNGRRMPLDLVSAGLAGAGA